MTKTAIISPAAAAQSANNDAELEMARNRLNDAIKRNKGRAFTYAASLFPCGCADTLVGELRRAGWSVSFVPDSRDGNYYEISP